MFTWNFNTYRYLLERAGAVVSISPVWPEMALGIAACKQQNCIGKDESTLTFKTLDRVIRRPKQRIYQRLHKMDIAMSNKKTLGNMLVCNLLLKENITCPNKEDDSRSKIADLILANRFVLHPINRPTPTVVLIVQNDKYCHLEWSQNCTLFYFITQWSFEFSQNENILFTNNLFVFVIIILIL